MPQKFGIIVDTQIVIAFKKVQIEAARIVTGLSIYASLDSIGVGNIKYKKGS